MLQLDNNSKQSNGSYLRRILHKALPILGNHELQYGNRSVIGNRSVHPLNRLPRRKRKRKRYKKQIPLKVLSNPTTVIYCTCGGQSLATCNLMLPKPYQSLPSRSLSICLSEMSEGPKFITEPRRTVKSVLRVKKTHEIAEAQLHKNEKLRQAFGISEYFVEGSSFDTERHAKEAAAKAALEETQKYTFIPSPPSSEDESTPTEKSAELSKSKKNKKASASHSDPSATNAKKKKKEKHKRKSELLSGEEKVSSRHKSKAEKKLKKKSRVSASPSKTNKHRKRNNKSNKVKLKKTKKKKSMKHTEKRSHKSRGSRSSSPHRSYVESDDYENSRKKKRSDFAKRVEEKKRSSSKNKSRVQDADSSSTAEYDRNKKRSSPKSKGHKDDKISSLTPDSSVEGSPIVDYRDDVIKHSKNKSEEKHSKREKEASRRQHRSKRESSPIEGDQDDFGEPRISDKSRKISCKESSRSKKLSPDRQNQQRNPSVERRRGECKSVSESSSKRKYRDSSSEREFTEKQTRPDDSREKSTRKRETSRDKFSKPFYSKKTRLTVSDSKSDSSTSSSDRPKLKSKLNHKSNKMNANPRYCFTSAARNKNRFPNGPDSDPKRSSEEDNSKRSRESRFPPCNESSKTFENYLSADKSNYAKNDSDKSRSESVIEGPKRESQPEVPSRMTMPSKINDNKYCKTVIDAQRNGVETVPAAENVTINVDGSIDNRDSSTSSSLSYSPMEKYPYRYKDILADVSRSEKSDVSIRRSKIGVKLNPTESDDRFKIENEVKASEVEEKITSVSSLSTKNAVPAANESKSEDSFCVNEVPLPPESDSSSTKLPSKRDDVDDDNDASSPKKATKMSNLTSAVVKSIPSSISLKPNTLASSINDVITKSMRKLNASTSSSGSSRKRKSRSSSRSSSSSDSSLCSRKRSYSDSSSSSSRSSSRGSTRRRRRRQESCSSDLSSSSGSSDSSRWRSRGRSTTKSKRKKKKRGARSSSYSDFSRSYSSSYSSSRSRSISIPRRKGSPCFLERRRITSQKRRRRSLSSGRLPDYLRLRHQLD